MWNPGWKPCKTPLDFYECRHGMSYTRITGRKNGVEASVLFFVPLKKWAEVQKLTLTNQSDEVKQLKLFSFEEWCLWNAATDMENFQRNFSTGEVEIEGSTIYHKTEYRERRNHYAFYHVNSPIQGFDTDRETFIGLYNEFADPQVVMEGKPRNSHAHGWSPIVIYGTPGLNQLYGAYDVLDKKIQTCKKPIFPILPSLHTAGPEVEAFLKRGHVNFSDEVTLATALSQIMQTPQPAPSELELYGVDVPKIRDIITSLPPSVSGTNGDYVSPEIVRQLLSCAGIPLVPEMVSTSKDELTAFAEQVGYPVVAKVVGPVHKSDVGGVTLNIRTAEHLSLEFDRMMRIPDATGVMVQKMLKGTELFIGAKYEERFGHVVLCGLGGIFVEVLKDVSSGLAPLSYAEAYSMIHSLKGYKIIKGTRGQKGIFFNDTFCARCGSHTSWSIST